MNGRPLTALALTALLIILCASLPKLAAFLSDGKQGSGYAPLNAVELTLRGGESMLSKIAVQCRADRYLEISEELASHTYEEMLDFAAEALKPYQESGIILTPDLDVYSQVYSCEPYIAVAEGEGETRSAVYWAFRVLFDEEEPVLILTLDDATGKLVTINYSCSKEIWFDKETSLPQLVELYFTALGENVPQIDAPNMQSKHEAGKITAQRWPFYWEDPTLGDCGIHFYLDEYGFAITYLTDLENDYE